MKSNKKKFELQLLNQKLAACDLLITQLKGIDSGANVSDLIEEKENIIK